MHQNIKAALNSNIIDPIPALIERLSTSENIRVKIQNANDNILLDGQKKDWIQITSDLNENKNPFPNPKNLLRIFTNRRSPNFPNQEQKHLLTKLKQIPCYTVTNKKNEIIMASPRIHEESNILSWFKSKYQELFFWSGDEGSVSLSLFFMNREDAATYLQEICRKEPKESEVQGLKIKTVGLDTFYKFNRTSTPKTQTKLICDLHEMETMLREHLNKSSNTINPKQKYSKNWFQGTPIYIFRTYTNVKEKNIDTYTYELGNEKKVVFFNQDDALRAWKSYLTKSNKLYIKKAPNLEIYNLESLLLDIENDKLENLEQLTIIPPFSWYQENTAPKEIIESEKKDLLENQLFKTKLKLKELQRFYKGLIWLLTSDTLPSEENSW